MSASNRRAFLKESGLCGLTAAAVGLTPAVGSVLGANDRLHVGVIGCGGRGRRLLRFRRELRRPGGLPRFTQPPHDRFQLRHHPVGRASIRRAQPRTQQMFPTEDVQRQVAVAFVIAEPSLL